MNETESREFADRVLETAKTLFEEAERQGLTLDETEFFRLVDLVRKEGDVDSEDEGGVTYILTLCHHRAQSEQLTDLLDGLSKYVSDRRFWDSIPLYKHGLCYCIEVERVRPARSIKTINEIAAGVRVVIEPDETDAERRLRETFLVSCLHQQQYRDGYDISLAITPL